MKDIQILEDTETETLVNEKFNQGMPYAEFRTLVDQLAAEGKTTGIDQKESFINYTQLNSHRMKRWDKTFKIPEGTIDLIKGFDKKVNWVVLTESWCGDASPTLPVMNRIAALNPNIQLRILLRDENLDLMEQFRTNGALSIPKLIASDADTGRILGEWGPRPSIATQMARDFKEEHGLLTPEFKEDLQHWYNRDKGQNTLDDLLDLLALK